MRGALTKRQREVYDYIVRYQKENHRPPSEEEIAHDCPGKSARGRVAVSSVSEILDRLEEKGYLVHGRFGHHGHLIQPVEDHPTEHTFVTGKLAASGSVTPITPQGLTFRLDILRREQTFFLVAADAIPPLLIAAGDLLLFERGRPLSPDDRVLFTVEADGEASVTYLVRYAGATTRALWDDLSRDGAIEPSEFLDREPHHPRTVKGWGEDAGFVVKGITAMARASDAYARFLEWVRRPSGRMRVEGVQVGLLRLESVWARERRPR